MAVKTRNLVRLKCSDCSKINYYYWKKKGAEYKLNLKKYCKNCRKHTNHKEVKR
ncbi:MAG: 50S ribosomal protein L33 [Patescibacteria group bacterium]